MTSFKIAIMSLCLKQHSISIAFIKNIMYIVVLCASYTYFFGIIMDLKFVFFFLFHFLVCGQFSLTDNITVVCD